MEALVKNGSAVYEGDTNPNDKVTVHETDPDNEETVFDYLGTRTVWQSTNPAQRWNPNKRYILVETSIGAIGNSDYNTLVKDDVRVQWYYIIEPVAKPDKDNPPTFYLRNINGFAHVELKKTVLENSVNSESDVVDGKVDSLLDGNRNVVFKIEPTITGANQMLEVFKIEDLGLTKYTPVSPEYEIKKITIGKASQVIPKTITLPENTEAFIEAIVTFNKADGSSETQTYTVSDSEKTVDAPATTQSFTIEYVSRAIKTATNELYKLSEQFRADPILVYMTVMQIPEGTPPTASNPSGSPAIEIEDFTNVAKANLQYHKWDRTGSEKTLVDEKPEAEAKVQVKQLEIPVVTIEKASDADENKKIKTGSYVKYTLTVKNLSTTCDFVNPVILDILPTGITFADDDGHEVTYSIPEGSHVVINTLEPKPVQGTYAQKIKMPSGLYDYADPETGVMFLINGTIAPGSSFSISFYAFVSASATLYHTSQGIKAENDVYLSSSKRTHYTTSNPYGYSFAVSEYEGEYTFGDLLKDSSQKNPNNSYPTITVDNETKTVAEVHEEGVDGKLQDFLGIDYTGTDYPWIRATNVLDAVQGSSLTLEKYVKADRDTGGFHQGLGVASRTNSTPGRETMGYVEWRLVVNNGESKAAQNLVIGDVIPKRGDNEDERNSQWDVIFNEIQVVLVNGQPVESNKYTIWYYTGDIGNAEAALNASMKTVRTWGAEQHEFWTTAPAGIDPSLDTEAIDIMNPEHQAALTEREKITAFMIVFDPSIQISASDSLVVTYHSTVKDYTSDNWFNENAAFKNCTNDFCFYYKGYFDVQTSNPVSVTLMDQYVQIEGDVWIDEDWDNTQQSAGNRRKYEKYQIVKDLADSITFSIVDLRKSAAGDSWTEDKPYGTNTPDLENNRPGYGESIRHFIFTELSPALKVNDPLYYPAETLNVLGDTAHGIYKALKGDDPYNYLVNARISNTALLDVYELVTKGSGYYMSDDPDALTRDSDNTLDSNFFTVSNVDDGRYTMKPFFIRYSNNVDQSKDIGFRAYRSLEITKVAQDKTSLKLEGAEFQIYGPYDDTYSKVDEEIKHMAPANANGVAAADLLKFKEVKDSDNKVLYYELDPEGTVDTLKTNADGQILVKGLNWWKEYIVKETKVPEGYEQDGATVTATDTPTGKDGKWHDENDAEYSEIEDLGNGAFLLKIPAIERTVSNSTIAARVEDPRRVDVQLNVEKLLQTLSTKKQTFKFDLRLTDASPENLKTLNASLMGRIIETLTIEVDGSDKNTNGWPYELSSFKKVTLNGEGTYTFTITEQAPTVNPKDGVTYDSTLVRTVTVKVEWKDKDTENGITKAGLYVTEINYQIKDTIEEVDYEKFTNKYEASGTWNPPVYKVLESRDIAEGETFTVQVKDSTGKVVLIGTVTGNGQNGKMGEETQFDFGSGITYYVNDKQNDVLSSPYTYTITEVVTDQYNMVYDKTVHNVTVTLEDDGKGQIKVTPVYDSEKVTFTNEHLFSLKIKKVLNETNPDPNKEFEFTLKLTKADGTPLTGVTLPAGKENNDSVRMTERNGVYSFKLKHNQTIELVLPDGTKYEIEELTPGYSAQIQVDYAEGSRTQPAEYVRKVDDQILVATGNQNVTYTNTPGIELPKTGGSGTLPYTAAGLGMISAAIGYGMYLHKKKKEEDPEGSESM